ncbi:MAG TPA: endonuclease/exonuclease/phosphatase family protein [Mycobacteriales bacterium]|jgi:endonuclease/exonuclease/phosphatase family metal-dependent hydrolase|nr:endonuclease/exonuclease/phosphatase family protein [Mycobacteriales bacterium]
MPANARRVLPALAVAGVLGALLVPAAASAEVARPATPSGMQVVAATSSSFTVTVRPTANAKHYRLYASTVRSDVFDRNLSHAQASPLSRSPRMTVRGLTHRSQPYYYRVEAINRHRHHFSATIGEVGLEPARPSALTATANSVRSFLSWASGSATGYAIEQANDPTMTNGRRTYTIAGPTTSFTPYGLTKGHTYYFRVRSLNELTSSGFTAPVALRAQSSQQPVKVMTYNILEATNDGHQEGGNVIAPWSQRKAGVAGFIGSAAPDVVAIQEGAAWVGQVKGPRQVDSLRSALGGAYALANTEIPPTQHHYHRTGDYILYRKDTLAAVGAGNHWAIGNGHWAAYQILRDRASGAKFLFVCAHLIVPRGHANDLKREQETQRLVRLARAYASAHGVPVVYAGDFNSDQFNHNPNGPAVAMNAAGIPNAYNVAQHRTNAKYNTANQYVTRPQHYFAHMDEVFAPDGVAVHSWNQLLHVSRGKFVGVIPSDHNPVVVTLDLPY